MNPALTNSLKTRLREHPLYRSVNSLRAIQTFMERHVVCVLDFMTLLKSLQRDLAGTNLPWTPEKDVSLVRFINEIVLEEESSKACPGKDAISHYDWYCAAMEEVGADTSPIRKLEERLRAGTPLSDALDNSGLPPEAITFSKATAATLNAPLHVRAAIFHHSRESIIPLMFLELVTQMDGQGTPISLFRAYLQQHIDVDGDSHGPAAAHLQEALLDGDAVQIKEAEEGVRHALQARIELWDAIYERCSSLQESSLAQ